MWGWVGTGTILKLVAGLGVEMGIRVPGTVRDGYEYLNHSISKTQVTLHPRAAL